MGRRARRAVREDLRREVVNGRAAANHLPGAGLGPGLAIIRELCRLLGGEIRFDSQEGAGTIFGITFPVRLQTQ
ncbi:ATP-binding protein [Paraburkholderia sediminicola]|uniref:ATP-binding protein n=1 Tax=Paraburkholderia sediminicola TaxID=458836 RepID=UPI0038B6EA65